MKTHVEGNVCCGARTKVRARNVQAIVHNGFMFGTEELDKRDPRKNLQPTRYEVLEFCGSPTCEKVFRAEKEVEK